MKTYMVSREFEIFILQLLIIASIMYTNYIMKTYMASREFEVFISQLLIIAKSAFKLRLVTLKYK